MTEPNPRQLLLDPVGEIGPYADVLESVLDEFRGIHWQERHDRLWVAAGLGIAVARACLNTNDPPERAVEIGAHWTVHDVLNKEDGLRISYLHVDAIPVVRASQVGELAEIEAMSLAALAFSRNVALHTRGRREIALMRDRYDLDADHLSLNLRWLRYGLTAHNPQLMADLKLAADTPAADDPSLYPLIQIHRFGLREPRRTIPTIGKQPSARPSFKQRDPPPASTAESESVVDTVMVHEQLALDTIQERQSRAFCAIMTDVASRAGVALGDMSATDVVEVVKTYVLQLQSADVDDRTVKLLTGYLSGAKLAALATEFDLVDRPTGKPDTVAVGQIIRVIAAKVVGILSGQEITLDQIGSVRSGKQGSGGLAWLRNDGSTVSLSDTSGRKHTTRHP